MFYFSGFDKIKVGDNMLYSSKENEKIKMVKKLHDKKYRDMQGLFLIEGEHIKKDILKNFI